MPYHIARQTPDFLVALMSGNMEADVVDAFLRDISQVLDDGPCPMDILLDGRRVKHASDAARNQLEAVLNNPRIRHIAFVVDEPGHLFSAFQTSVSSKMVLFTNRQDAVSFLRNWRTPGSDRTRLQVQASLQEQEVGDTAISLSPVHV